MKNLGLESDIGTIYAGFLQSKLKIYEEKLDTAGSGKASTIRRSVHSP